MIGSIILLITTKAFSETVKLTIPTISEIPKQKEFFHELLATALKESDHIAILTNKNYPQKRIIQQLDSGNLSLFWMISSKERDEKYIPIKVNLTQQLIGKRILFIKHGDQHLYDNVKTLKDFKNLDLIAGMGANWFDAQVWKTNDLGYKEKEGNWKSIFKMIPRGHSYDYFARGINEIIHESEQYPDLDIEKNLVFIYDRDFQFYLSKTGINAGKPYQKILTEALQKAEKTGLINRLVEKYWGSNLKQLNYEQRTKIYLSLENN